MSTSTMTITNRPTSLSDSGVQLSQDVERPPDTLTSLTSPLSEGDDSASAKSRMEKYFAEKPDKNIFMKLIHPSYHERNLQFKKIFVEKRLIEENDQFLASYSCAYQREILAQGRMFISQFNVCFYANIIGWETNLVIPLKQIKHIKKTKAAFIFPNSIQFEKDTGEKYFFASFINRDKSYQVLTTAYQKAKDEIKAMTREEVWDMVYNSENSQNQTPPEGGTPASTKNASTENMTNLSSVSFNNGSISPRTDSSKHLEKDNTSQSSTSSDFHDDESAAQLSEPIDMDDEEVSCQCSEHCGRLLLDKEVKVSVEKFYELVFTESPFFSECNKKNKVDSYVAATWVRDHQGEATRSCTYNVSVSNPLATKAIIVNEKQVLHQFTNSRQGFTMIKETQNSGVPYADNFTVNCRYCVLRTGPASCRVKVHGGIVYKKNIWGLVKGFVEKGTYGALEEHYSILSNMFDEYAQNNPDEEKRSVTSARFPDGNDTTEASEPPMSGAPRRRRSQKTTVERLIAGGEKRIVDDQPQVNHRSATPSSSSSTEKSTENSSSYAPFLYAIVVLLALSIFSNFYAILSSSKEPAAIASKNEDLSEMLSALMSQVKELKDKVDQMKTSH